jgi:ribonucleoside-triphosphate reductase
MTAKYGIPYFSNFINSDMSPEDARSMCIDKDEDIMIKKDDTIQKCKIGELINNLNIQFDKDG